MLHGGTLPLCSYVTLGKFPHYPGPLFLSLSITYTHFPSCLPRRSLRHYGRKTSNKVYSVRCSKLGFPYISDSQ